MKKYSSVANLHNSGMKQKKTLLIIPDLPETLLRQNTTSNFVLNKAPSTSLINPKLPKSGGVFKRLTNRKNTHIGQLIKKFG